MLNCYDATRLMSESQERPLSWRERIALRIHTLICAGCQNFRAQMLVIRRAMHLFAREDGKDQRDEK